MPAPYLADPSDLARRTGLDAGDPDLLLELRRASARFRLEAGHPVTLVTDDLYYANGDGGSALRLPAAPIIGTPVVTIGGTTGGTVVTDFQTGRRSGLLRRAAGWPDGLENIQVLYSHGYAEVPEDIADAIIDAAEASLNLRAGIDSVSTGDESVKFTAALTAGGVTERWTNAVAKYALGQGDRS